MEFPVIDSHQHFWDLEANGKHYHWLNEIKPGEKLAPLRKNYMPEDLCKDAEGCNLVKTIHVQGEWRGDTVGETKWLANLSKADGNPKGFPHAIVAYVDLSQDNAAALLDEHMEAGPVRGVRQLLNWHETDMSKRAADKDYLSDPVWRKNLSLLGARGLLFECHIWPAQMAAIAALAQEHPEIQFVIDHVGCPDDHSEGGYSSWLTNMKVLAAQPNIACKVSGLIHPMHTTKGEWSAETLKQWVKGTYDAFGPERCIWGSNFPVDGVCGSYIDILKACRKVLKEDMALTEEQLQGVFHDNAVMFYKLDK